MKKIMLLVFVIVLTIGLCSCGGGSDPAEEPETAAETQTQTEAVKIERSIDAVADALGLTEKSEVYYTVIDADDGAEFNGGAVELYQYDPENQVYKDICAGEGAIKAEAYNNGFILVVPDGTEADEDLVMRFKELSL